MVTMQRYHVIGLWQVWDEIPDAPHPQACPPDALLESHVKGYDAEPDERKARWDAGMHDVSIRAGVYECDQLGQRVIEDATWQAMLAKGGWNQGLTRRHRPGNAGTKAPAAYGLTEAQLALPAGSAWASAKNYGPRLADVASMLEEMNGGPTWIPGPKTPYERPRARERPLDRPDGRPAER